MNEQFPKSEHLPKTIEFNVPRLKDSSKIIEETYREISAQLGGRKPRTPGEVESMLNILDEEAQKLALMMESLRRYVKNQEGK